MHTCKNLKIQKLVRDKRSSLFGSDIRDKGESFDVDDSRRK
jgi:hypothetical protein